MGGAGGVAAAAAELRSELEARERPRAERVYGQRRAVTANLSVGL